jgi:hypothetical protein
MDTRSYARAGSLLDDFEPLDIAPLGSRLNDRNPISAPEGVVPVELLSMQKPVYGFAADAAKRASGSPVTGKPAM